MKTLDYNYRNQNYFNDKDIYVFNDDVINHIFLSKVHKYRGDWYTDESLNFKCTSIPCINSSDIINKTVNLKSYNIKGVINKFLPPNDLGIFWKQNQNLPYFWNNIKTVEIFNT